ncbi:MAG TPA: hypothetical protein VGN26_07590 [Armatimonadota bacterium]|jgi:hypothetical protein
MNKRRTLAVAALCAVAATGAYAAKKVGPFFADLFPPSKGTYQQPAGALGDKPAQPWTATTLEAAVQNKPLAGKVETRTGEIIDYSCYLQLGKHGAKHRDCAQKCLKNGQPIGLLSQDGSITLLMEEEHHPRRDGQTTFRDAAIEHAGEILEVTGTASKVNGQKALYVQGFVRK